MLVAEQDSLLLVEDRSDQDGQINARLYDRSYVKMAIKLLNCLLLQSHATVPPAQATAEADAYEPRVRFKSGSLGLLCQHFCLFIAQVKWLLVAKALFFHPFVAVLFLIRAALYGKPREEALEVNFLGID